MKQKCSRGKNCTSTKEQDHTWGVPIMRSIVFWGTMLGPVILMHSGIREDETGCIFAGFEVLLFAAEGAAFAAFGLSIGWVLPTR